MADFPTSIFSPRTLVNKTGVTYDAPNTKVLFAEDLNRVDAEVVAIENYLLNRYHLKPDLLALALNYPSETFDGSPAFLQMETANTVNSSKEISIPNPDSYYYYPDFSKNPILDFDVVFNFSGAFESYIASGDLNSGYGIGFKFTNTNIYIGWSDAGGTPHYVSVGSVTNNQKYSCRYEYISGSVLNYYLDNVLVYTLNIITYPIYSGGMYPIEIGLINKAVSASAPCLGIFQIEFNQVR